MFPHRWTSSSCTVYMLTSRTLRFPAQTSPPSPGLCAPVPPLEVTVSECPVHSCSFITFKISNGWCCHYSCCTLWTCRVTLVSLSLIQNDLCLFKFCFPCIKSVPFSSSLISIKFKKPLSCLKDCERFLRDQALHAVTTWMLLTWEFSMQILPPGSAPDIWQALGLRSQSWIKSLQPLLSVPPHRSQRAIMTIALCSITSSYHAPSHLGVSAQAVFFCPISLYLSLYQLSVSSEVIHRKRSLKSPLEEGPCSLYSLHLNFPFITVIIA